MKKIASTRFGGLPLPCPMTLTLTLLHSDSNNGLRPSGAEKSPSARKVIHFWRLGTPRNAGFSLSLCYDKKPILSGPAHPADKKLRRSEKQTEPWFFRVDLNKVEKWSGLLPSGSLRIYGYGPSRKTLKHHINGILWEIHWIELQADYMLNISEWYIMACVNVDLMEAMADYQTW